MKPLGAILAGGRSSRFGSDKALACYEGRPLIEHVARALGVFVDEVVVCGRHAPLAGMTAVPDRPAPDLGPLGGLCGALHYALALGRPLVLSVGCDMPALPARLIERLIESGGPTYVAEVPILGCWPATLAEELETHLSQQDNRSMRHWTAAINARAIAAECELPNINRPEDLARLSDEATDRRPRG